MLGGAARSAFVEASSEAMLVAAAVVFVAAALVARYMPAGSAVPEPAPAQGPADRVTASSEA